MQKSWILPTRAPQIPWSNSIVFRFRQAKLRAARSFAKNTANQVTGRFGLKIPLEGRVCEFPGPIRSYLVGHVYTCFQNINPWSCNFFRCFEYFVVSRECFRSRFKKCLIIYALSLINIYNETKLAQHLGESMSKVGILICNRVSIT